MSRLSQFYIDKAKRELNEDETRKQQSLTQFKEWIHKHPYIKCNYTDDDGILVLLRSKKYSMPAVYEMVECGSPFIKSHPEWYDLSGDRISESLKLLNDCCYMMIPKRGENGERILVIRHKLINMKIHSANNVYRTYNMFVGTFILEHETQISGFIVINDYSGVSFDYVSQFQLKHYLEVSKIVKHIPGRMKKNFFLGIPNFAAIFFNQCTKALLPKFQERIFLLKNGTELLKYFDKSLLLEDYGGIVTEEQCKMEFQEKFNQQKENIKRSYNVFDVDFKKIQKTDEVGSFRKLDFD